MSRSRSGRWSGLTLLIVVVLSVGAAGSEAAASRHGAAPLPTPSTSTTFGLGPADAKKIDGRPYFNYVASPGARFTDHVAILNLSVRPQALAVYVTDVSNSRDGAFSYPGSQAKVTDAGGWIALQTPRHATVVTLPARGTAIFPLSVAVPADASPGDHAAAVIVSLTAVSKDGNGQRVALEQRVAARAFFRVSGPLRPSLTVEALRASYQAGDLRSGSATVTYRVRNTGNVKLGGRQRVTVSGQLSGSTKQGVAVPVLLPGGVVDVKTRVPDVLPQVLMSAKVTVTPLGVSGDTLPLTKDAISAIRFWAVPWLVLLLVLLLVLVLVLARRRQCRRRDSASSPRHVRTRGAVDRPAVDIVLRTRRPAARRAALGSALVILLLGAPVGTASAGSVVPYADPGVTGSIGLCDINGHNVLSGKVTDKPFVWRAVGTTAAPGQYAAAGRTAYLTAYQPRKGIDPGDWSGYQLAASSRYSNAAHPMSQATPISGSLGQFLGRYPPGWDGLVQLRLILAGSNRPPLQGAYDATDLKVEGDTWRVVRGGTGPCHSGTAVSMSTLLKVPGSQGTPKPGAVASPPSFTGSPEPVVAGSASPVTGRVSNSAAPSSPGSGGAPAGTAGTMSSSTTALAVGGGLALLVAFALTAWAVRRRSAA